MAKEHIEAAQRRVAEIMNTFSNRKLSERNYFNMPVNERKALEKEENDLTLELIAIGLSTVGNTLIDLNRMATALETNLNRMTTALETIEKNTSPV